MENYSGLENWDQASQKPWIGNMTLTLFCTSKWVLNCLLEKTHNRIQCLTKVLELQFLESHQTKCLQIIYVTETVLLTFVDTNIQQKHIFLRINKQKHPTPWKLATPYFHRARSEKWHGYCLVFNNLYWSFRIKLRRQTHLKFLIECLILS